MATASCALNPAPSVVDALAAGGKCKPPSFPRSAGGASGRRFCRIYPDGSQWVLQLQPSAWPANNPDEATRLRFLTLTAAIGYAVAKDLSYRVVHAVPAGH